MRTDPEGSQDLPETADEADTSTTQSSGGTTKTTIERDEPVDPDAEACGGTGQLGAPAGVSVPEKPKG